MKSESEVELVKTNLYLQHVLSKHHVFEKAMRDGEQDIQSMFQDDIDRFQMIMNECYNDSKKEFEAEEKWIGESRSNNAAQLKSKYLYLLFVKYTQMYLKSSLHVKREITDLIWGTKSWGGYNWFEKWRRLSKAQ